MTEAASTSVRRLIATLRPCPITKPTASRRYFATEPMHPGPENTLRPAMISGTMRFFVRAVRVRATDRSNSIRGPRHPGSSERTRGRGPAYVDRSTKRSTTTFGSVYARTNGLRRGARVNKAGPATQARRRCGRARGVLDHRRCACPWRDRPSGWLRLSNAGCPAKGSGQLRHALALSPSNITGGVCAPRRS